MFDHYKYGKFYGTPDLNKIDFVFFVKFNLQNNNHRILKFSPIVYRIQ